MASPIMPTRAIDRLLSLLKGVKAVGTGRWMALCPAHEDRERSLSIAIGRDERIVMKCHATCETRAIVAAVGLTMGDLFVGPVPASANGAPRPAQGVESRAKLVKSYDYYAADGRHLFQTCRLEPKTFRQRHRSGRGEWVWNIDGITPVLYRLPEIIEAVAQQKRIFIVEGEKDADALVELGYQATTSPMGAGKWKEAYADTLAGADVVILPDNDEPGQKHAEQVAASLAARGTTVRIVALPDLPPKGDVSDWLAASGDLDQLEALIAKTPTWAPDPSKRTMWWLYEIWESPELMRPPPPVIPYLAWASRSTLLASREKSGKSTLTGYMAAQVSRGGEFLGEPCAYGKVLIVGLEEYLGDTARRLKEFNADGRRIAIMDRFVGTFADRPSEVRERIEAVKPVLVILDSLVAYSQGVVSDASSAVQTQAVVQGLTDLAHTLAVALVIIHHARKVDGKYRDSSAIGGAVDIIAEVYPPEECATTDPNRRRVRPIGRVPTRGVDFRFDGHEYTLVDPSGPTKAPLDQRIISVVRERPGLSANDVYEAVGDQRQTVLTRIQFMINQGQLVNDGTNQYKRLRLPSFAPAPGLL